MLFDISSYDQYILYFSFIVIISLLVYFFRKNFISIIDPLITHLIWTASHFSFLLAYIYKFGFSTLPVFFLFILTFYTVVYQFFLRKSKLSIVAVNIDAFKSKKTRIKLTFIALLVCNLISKYNLFIYIIHNPSILSWFLYRFVEMQGRDPLLRILSTATQVYLLYFAFVVFAILKQWRFFVVIAYATILLLEILTGSRSILLSVIFYIGLCMFYFKDFFSFITLKKFSRTAIIFCCGALVTAIVVSAFYGSDYTFGDGVGIVLNRFFAAGDGLEYYMNYNGLANIKSGFSEFIYSVFGIYIKRVTGGSYDNIGLQLFSLVRGDIEFTEGPNYTVLLQVMVLGYQYFIFYIPFIAFIGAKLRSVKFSSLSFLPLSFFLSATSFTMVIDLEFWVLNIISGVIVFYTIIWPLNKIKFR